MFLIRLLCVTPGLNKQKQTMTVYLLLQLKGINTRGLFTGHGGGSLRANDNKVIKEIIVATNFY